MIYTLVPMDRDPAILWCAWCGSMWRPSGGGRLRKADPRLTTDGELALAIENDTEEVEREP
jgi:hypothetical protein